MNLTSFADVLNRAVVTGMTEVKDIPVGPLMKEVMSKGEMTEVREMVNVTCLAEVLPSMVGMWC